LFNLKERDHTKNLDVDKRIKLNWIFKKWEGDVEWIDMTLGRDKWRALVNTSRTIKFGKHLY
jgi:hypothetical protein